MADLEKILGGSTLEGLRYKLYDVGRAVLGKTCRDVEGPILEKNSRAEVSVGYCVSSLRSGTISRAARGLLRKRVNAVLMKYGLRLHEVYKNRTLVDDGLRIGPDPLKESIDYDSYP